MLTPLPLFAYLTGAAETLFTSYTSEKLHRDAVQHFDRLLTGSH
ncbi:MAG TPA: hypothetical protein VKR06_18340 [Ktedonosporobacter sp.]|nr:hypothetical protein [Ktedonosporobacter sp.]